MNIVINAFIAALLYLAYAHQSSEALSVAVAILWTFTVLLFLGFLGSGKIKNKKHRPIMALINGVTDCSIGIALVYLFGMVWLPTLYVLSAILAISALMLQKEEA